MTTISMNLVLQIVNELYVDDQNSVSVFFLFLPFNVIKVHQGNANLELNSPYFGVVYYHYYEET